MSKALINRTNIPYFDRDEFLTPFDRVFDQLFETNFPEFVRSVGVKPYQGSAYPKVNVYEYDEKVGIIAEIPGLEKKDLTVEVEDGTLTISGVKHHIKEDEGAKVIRRELKASSFKRNFEIGENLDGENIKAVFKNGVLNIDIPKIEPEKPKKQFVKIS
jgi:HSP20 family protein|tara:strand:- start:254 stop:730 length:477 start_codon:yes stop_codon:yes gene_type:complete